MAKSEKSLAKRLAAKYREASSRAPEAKLALDLHPVTGIAMSALDAAASAAEGNYGDAGLELLGVVPGVKYIPGAGATKAFRKYADAKSNAARTIDRASDSVSYATSKIAAAKEKYSGTEDKGAAESAAKRKDKETYKKGGLAASKRADGIAVRGKTRGRMI